MGFSPHPWEVTKRPPEPTSREPHHTRGVISSSMYPWGYHFSLWGSVFSFIKGWKSSRVVAAAAAAKSLQSCPTLCDPIDRSSTGSSAPGILQGKNTGVGCHFLLQCMKVKSESEVAQLCPTLRDPMDCSPPGSSVHGIFQARVLEWGAPAFSVRIVRKPKWENVVEKNLNYDCHVRICATFQASS